ncbi:hypothetical protein BDZ91DRAFT_765156 [Kalaharituber pfeilii]|nr:hypothetical protein BDZ91DRAFT_765156 [Kalaharituber pfeilii]
MAPGPLVSGLETPTRTQVATTVTAFVAKHVRPTLSPTSIHYKPTSSETGTVAMTVSASLRPTLGIRAEHGNNYDVTYLPHEAQRAKIVGIIFGVLLLVGSGLAFLHTFIMFCIVSVVVDVVGFAAAGAPFAIGRPQTHEEAGGTTNESEEGVVILMNLQWKTANSQGGKRGIGVRVHAVVYIKEGKKNGEEEKKFSPLTQFYTTHLGYTHIARSKYLNPTASNAISFQVKIHSYLRNQLTIPSPKLLRCCYVLQRCKIRQRFGQGQRDTADGAATNASNDVYSFYTNASNESEASIAMQRIQERLRERLDANRQQNRPGGEVDDNYVSEIRPATPGEEVDDNNVSELRPATPVREDEVQAPPNVPPAAAVGPAQSNHNVHEQSGLSDPCTVAAMTEPASLRSQASSSNSGTQSTVQTASAGLPATPQLRRTHFSATSRSRSPVKCDTNTGCPTTASITSPGNNSTGPRSLHRRRTPIKPSDFASHYPLPPPNFAYSDHDPIHPVTSLTPSLLAQLTPAATGSTVTTLNTNDGSAQGSPAKRAQLVPAFRTAGNVSRMNEERIPPLRRMKAALVGIVSKKGVVAEKDSESIKSRSRSASPVKRNESPCKKNESPVMFPALETIHSNCNEAANTNVDTRVLRTPPGNQATGRKFSFSDGDDVLEADIGASPLRSEVGDNDVQSNQAGVQDETQAKDAPEEENPATEKPWFILAPGAAESVGLIWKPVPDFRRRDSVTGEKIFILSNAAFERPEREKEADTPRSSVENAISDTDNISLEVNEPLTPPRSAAENIRANNPAHSPAKPSFPSHMPEPNTYRFSDTPATTYSSYGTAVKTNAQRGPPSPTKGDMKNAKYKMKAWVKRMSKTFDDDDEEYEG